MRDNLRLTSKERRQDVGFVKVERPKYTLVERPPTLLIKLVASIPCKFLRQNQRNMNEKAGDYSRYAKADKETVILVSTSNTTSNFNGRAGMAAVRLTTVLAPVTRTLERVGVRRLLVVLTTCLT